MPSLDNSGIPEQYIAISNDITLHKESEDQLKENMVKFQKLNEDSEKSQKKFRVLYDKTPTLLRTITTDGILTDCNEAYLNAFGYTVEEDFGQKCLGPHRKKKFQRNV